MIAKLERTPISTALQNKDQAQNPQKHGEQQQTMNQQHQEPLTAAQVTGDFN